MDTKTARWLDRHIGRSLTLLLTLHRRLRDALAPKAAGHEGPKKILFIKLIEQGSTVLAYPALKEAERRAGRENLFFLVLGENKAILEILDVIPPGNIFVVDSSSTLLFIMTSLKAVREIRRRRIGAVIDMEFFARASAILAYLTGAPIRVGLHLFYAEGPFRGDLFTHRMVYNPYLPVRTYFLSLVMALTRRPPSDRGPMVFAAPDAAAGAPRFLPADDEKEAVIEKVERLKGGPLTRPVIILNPNRGDLIPLRRWPVENFVELGAMIVKEIPGATIVATGRVEEKEETDRLASRVPGAVSLAGRTGMRELLTLFSVSDILVTNDSGPAHFASLTFIRPVILFGPETPVLYGLSGGRTEIIYRNMVCSPCVNVYNQRESRCGSVECLKGVTPREVFVRIKRIAGGGD